ncbi:MAG TPA: phosphodiester glycosidase family protein [Candidatus Binatia bacterium]|nr:phosphodiester glycosidase family protein [Candidatus Binatia bacterium]
MVRLAITVALLILLSSSSGSVSSQISPTKLKSNPALTVSDAGVWKTIQHGVEFRKMSLERAEPGLSIDLKLLRFDTRLVVPRVLRSAQFQLKSANAKTFAEKSGALATINGSYFDTDGKPLAFLKVDSQAINARVAKNSLYTGVFSVKDQQPLISHRDDFLPEQADEGLQCGPLLLLHGNVQAVTGVPSRASRRALIGIDQQQRLVIAVGDSLFGGLYWPELQELFSAAPWQIQVADLLNLDGGGSAQLYVKAGKFEELVAGTAEVPVAIGFFNRGN